MKRALSLVLAMTVGLSSIAAGTAVTRKKEVKAQETSTEMKMPIVIYDHLDDHFLFEYDLGTFMGLSLYQDYTEKGVPDGAGKGLVETELGENGTPVYKKETIERAALIMKEYIEQDYKIDNELHNKIRSKVSKPGKETVVTNNDSHAMNLEDNGWSVPSAAEYVAKDRNMDKWLDSDGNTIYSLQGDKLVTAIGGADNKAVLDFGNLAAGDYTFTLWQADNMDLVISANGNKTTVSTDVINQSVKVSLKEAGHIVLTATPKTTGEAFITNPSLYYDEARTNPVIANANQWHNKDAKEEGWIFEKESSWKTSPYGGITCEDDEKTVAKIGMSVTPGKEYIVKAETIESDLAVAKVTTPDGTKLADVSTTYDRKNAFTVPESVTKVILEVAPKGEGATQITEGKKVRRFDNVYIKELADVKLGDYEESKKAFSVDHTKNKLDDIETCMDYIYYMTNNFWSDTANDVTQRTSLYKTLTLSLDDEKKVYEFDNNHKINYDLENKDISQNQTQSNVNEGFYPLDKNRLGSLSDFTAPFGQYDIEHPNVYEEGTPNHNYHFAMKAHCEFYYDKASDLEFNFRGDDDVYVFINNKLALDIGGAHPALNGTVKVNDIADDLGLKDGEIYTFDFFYMERHTTDSNIRIHTNMILLPADAKGSVVFKDKDGNEIEDGAKVTVGEKVNVEYSVKAGVKDMSNITFVDSDLGTTIGKDGLDLGQCTVDGELKVTVTDKQGNVVKTVSISKDDLNDADKVKEFSKKVGELKLDKDNVATLTGLVREMPADKLVKSTLDVDITAPQIAYDQNGRIVFIDEPVTVNQVVTAVVPKNEPKAEIDVKITDNAGNELSDPVTEGTNVNVEYKLTAKSNEMSKFGIDDEGTGFKISGDGIVIPEGYNIDNGLTVTLHKDGKDTVVTITKEDIQNKTDKYTTLLSNLEKGWNLDNNDYIKVTGLNTDVKKGGIKADAKGSVSGPVPTYDENTGEVSVALKEVNPTDKAELDAKPNAEVKFVVDPEKGNTGNDKTVYIVDIGEKTGGEPKVVVEDGYEFIGWQKTTDSDKTPVKADDPKNDVITENTTYTAVFNPKQYPYTVRYVDENGKDIIDLKQGDPADFKSTVEEKAPVIKGYGVDGESTKTLEITTDPKTNEIIFTYKKGEFPYTVKYVDEKGNEIADPTDGSAKFEETVETKAKDIKGYTLTEQDGKKVKISDDAEKNVVTYVYKVNEYPYTVRYVDKEGNDIIPAKQGEATAFGSKVTEEAVKLTGFVLDDESSKTIKIDTEKNEIVFVYDVLKLNVEFTADKGGALTGDTSDRTVDYNTSVKDIPTPQADRGYEFAGWVMSNENTEGAVICEEPSKELITVDTVFTAKFNPKKYDYIVKYVDEDGNEVYPSKAVEGADFDSEVTENAIDVTGYKLTGDETKTIVINDEKNEIVFVYTKKEYKVTFKPKDNGTITKGDPNQTVKYNETSTEPTVTANKGYKFVGWTTTDENGKEVIVTDVNNYKITRDTVFTANYEEIKTTTITSSSTTENNKKTTDVTVVNKEETTAEVTKTTKTSKKTKNNKKSNKKNNNNDKNNDSNKNVIVRKENSIIKKGVNNSTVAPKTGVKDIFNGFAMMIIMAILGLFISVLNLRKEDK
ncbi:MAG: fibro-slime domain-containing protein [Lachnospiraceae bacterium]|nr:fibro-slime domain-containing protein [Lachnospiraceae bacterium]